MNNIVVPSYSNHLQCNIYFLKSIKQMCSDLDNITITFIVQENDYEQFNVLKDYGINTSVLCLNQIIMDIEGTKIDEDDLLDKHGKYIYQSIKKLYGVLYCESNKCLVLDSENVCVNRFNSDELFSSAFNNTILFARQHRSTIQHTVNRDVAKILNFPNINEWMFVTSYWPYNRGVVGDLMFSIEHNHNDSFLNIIKRQKCIFDYVLYANFIRANNRGYTFKCIDDELAKYIDSNYITHAYRDDMTPEYICRYINNDNVKGYCEFLNDNNIPIARTHWINDDLKQYIINNSNIKIATYHKD